MDEELYGRFYEIESTHWWFAARRFILLRYLRRQVAPGSRPLLLDAGCGTGAILAEASRDFNACGMDTSPTAIQFCRSRGLTDVRVCTLNEYPTDQLFDIIMLLDVIEHTPDDQEILRQARLRLRKGGHLLITVPAYRWLWSTHDVKNHHYRRYTARQVRKVVHDSGFIVMRLSYFNTLLFPLAAVRRLGSKVFKGPAIDEFAFPPRWLNTLLNVIFKTEGYVLPHFSLPFGLSVFCWATKADA
jgi:SAM-dependent methyltransferase